MAACRVFTKPDGAVRILYLVTGTLDAATARDETLAGLPYVDLDVAELPATRRDAWRVRGGRVIVDDTVPVPISPRDQLKLDVQAATTVAALKAAMLRLLG